MYNRIFKDIYPNGWEDSPSKNTPITAESIQQYNDVIRNIENYLKDNEIQSYQTKRIEEFEDARYTNNPVYGDAVWVDSVYNKETGWVRQNLLCKKLIPAGYMHISDAYFTDFENYDPDVVANLIGGLTSVGNISFLNLKFDIIDWKTGDYYLTQLPLITGVNASYPNFYAVKENEGIVVPVTIYENGWICVRLYTNNPIGTWNLSMIFYSQYE